MRAKKASEILIKLAEEKDKVIVVGHGYMNLHIRKLLVQQGWHLNMKSNKFWGVSNLKH